MTFLQIQYFIEVCRFGSTLKASQELNVSQSTISTSIRSLESELNVSLFERTSKGMVPTAAGSFFLERCQEILQKAQALKADMEQFSSVKRPIRLGIPVRLNHLYWADLYFQLKTAFPEMEFQSINRTVPVLLEMLKHNEIDGVMFQRNGQKIDGNFVILRKETGQYVSMSTSHPLANEKAVSYRQLLEYPVLRYVGDDLYTKILEEQYRRFGGELKCTQRFDQLSSLLQFLRKNAGIAYLHKDITKSYPDLTSIPIIEEMKSYLTYFVWPKNGVLAHAPKRLIQTIQDYFKQLDA